MIAKKKKDAQLELFENPDIETTKSELAEIRHKHFAAKSASTKHRLRKQDQELREKLANLLSEDNCFAPEDAKQLSEWNPYDQNAVSSFFDPEWMFGVSDGFDLVIGNPPYIQLQSNGGKLGKLYEKSGYCSFDSKGDVYCLFYERGWQLLKRDGHLCFITSNKWMRAGYGAKLREFFAKKTNPLLLIDFAGVKVLRMPHRCEHLDVCQVRERAKDNLWCSEQAEQRLYQESERFHSATERGVQFRHLR